MRQKTKNRRKETEKSKEIKQTHVQVRQPNLQTHWAAAGQGPAVGAGRAHGSRGARPIVRWRRPAAGRGSDRAGSQSPEFAGPKRPPRPCRGPAEARRAGRRGSGSGRPLQACAGHAEPWRPAPSSESHRQFAPGFRARCLRVREEPSLPLVLPRVPHGLHLWQRWGSVQGGDKCASVRCPGPWLLKAAASPESLTPGLGNKTGNLGCCCGPVFFDREADKNESPRGPHNQQSIEGGPGPLKGRKGEWLLKLNDALEHTCVGCPSCALRGLLSIQGLLSPKLVQGVSPGFSAPPSSTHGPGYLTLPTQFPGDPGYFTFFTLQQPQ